jgi:C2 domain
LRQDKESYYSNPSDIEDNLFQNRTMKIEMPNIEEVSSASSYNELSDDISMPSCNSRQDFIGELVGATDLVVDDDDVGIVRPYAEVYFGKNKIHYSEPSEGLSPIWTIDTDSLFLLKATPLELTCNVLTVKILTSRSISPLTEIKSFLGQASLKPEDFLKLCNGDRFELNVQDELCDDTSCRGKLALRLRLATPADVRFVTLWNGRRLKENTIVKALLHHEDTYKDKQKAILVSETNESKAAGDSFRNAINSALDFSSFFESQRGGEQRKKIKPFPDPSRPKSTRFLTPHEIKVETRRPSENWVQAGSGTLGKLYVEILACHGLPNVDVGEAIGNVTDSFVALVFEDALAETPVIDDELSPHWLPWTQRAFCFGVMHPASTLYVGVFDYDIGPLANHEPLGRVAVNISNLQRDTLYTLRYNLFKSANVTDRTPIGQITMRVRVEIFDEKLSLLSALKPRPNIHVNVKKNKSFKVVRYVCFGEYDGEDKFDLTVTRSYINEIFEYKSHLSYAIRDSLESLMFWRGQVEVFSVLLPIHSMIFFFSTSTLVERPCLFPAFAILSVAWLMIANGRRRHQHPSPWCRCHTFLHYLGILINGKSSISFQKIKAYEGRDEAISCEEAWKKREEEDTKRAEKRADLERELQEHGDENIHTQVQMGIPLDLLERLGRYQGYIGSEYGVYNLYFSSEFLLLTIIDFRRLPIFPSA